MAAFVLLIVLLALLTLWNLGAGSLGLTAREAFRLLASGPDGTTAWGIVHDLRLPRILAAVILGGALSVSGFLLQTFF